MASAATPPTGFVLEEEPRATRRSDAPPPPPGFALEVDRPDTPEPDARRTPARVITGEVVDGDTIRSDGPNVRLWGVDAPELNQPGWNREGERVPVGEVSRDALAAYLAQGTPLMGDTAMESWGRPVAPVTVDGRDVGRDMLRSGDAFAAPDYLSADPDRRFDYVGAERLARLNRLGVHGVQTQDPADYRENGELTPEQRRRGHSWFNQTPFEGLTEEGRTQWLGVLRTGTADEIAAKARELGFTIDEDRNRDWVAWRDNERSAGREPVIDRVLYEREVPKPLIDGGGGQLGAGVRGFGDEFVLGGLGEVGAVVDALGGTEGRENIWNSDRRLADIWHNNNDQNAAILGYDSANYPVTSTTSRIGGALTSGFVLPYAQGMRARNLAAYGAGYGATSGFLGTDGSLGDRLTGAAIGTAVGAIADPALAKGLDLAAPFVARGARAVSDRVRGAGTSRRAVETTGSEAAMNNALDLPQGKLPPLPAGARLNTTAAMADDLGEAISAPVQRPQRLDQPLEDPARREIADNINPRDVLPMPSNRVDGVEEAASIDAGRYAEARAPNERDELQRRTVRNVMGREVPKVGPIDLVGWLRLRGGLREENGELASLGITNNAARRGMDFAGQEMRFGPMLADDGMTLDDAAFAAWEEGYFPELSERPDVNTFLEALGETYNGGSGRRFHVDDFAELDAYYGRQTERLDLEQQRYENGEPVYEDRAVAAAADQPFPPVEAYEEWPSDAIGRVGNIDVTRLDTPQDIRRALKTSHNALGGFDAATRGRITNAETERLASELNMTADQLLKRRRGQAFNAEEALAARRILAKSGNELVNTARRLRQMGDNPGSEAEAEFRKKWMRHVAIQEQVAGMTAEAGRVLQQFRQAANSREVRGDVLEALIRGGGGSRRMQEAADALIDMAETSPGKFNAFAEKAMKPKWRDKISELYINFLLSNPPTHVVNMVSNTLTALAQIPEYATGAAIGAARRAVMRDRAKDAIRASEVGARTIGLLQGAKEGARLFARALRSGEPDDFVSKVEGDQYNAISGLKGEVIRVPTRLLTAEDQFFKGIARRMELNGQAARIASREGLRGDAWDARVAELAANPTDEMLQRSLDYGKYLTFQTKLGETGRHVSGFAQSNILAKVVLPFVRTPINLMKFATERSIAAPLLGEWRADFRAGGEHRDLAVAKMLLGTGFATLFYEAALEGRITGGAPPDPAKARLMYADGWQPYSIRVGDRWISYSRLDPFSTTIGVAADMATLPDGLSDRQKDDKAMLLVASILGNLASKTWLSGVSAFSEALMEPGRYADNWLQRTAGAFAVPAGVAGVTRAVDPVMRNTDSVGEAIQARVPGMSSGLMPRRDVFGEPIEFDSLGPDFVSPFWQSQAQDDPVVREMLRIGKSVSAPGRQYTEDGERVDYTPEEYDRYSEIAGRLTYNALLGEIASPRWQNVSDKHRHKLATDAIREARATARSVIDDMSYELPERGAVPELMPADTRAEPAPLPTGFSADGVPAPPPGFTVE
ncbi:thermonuclease family protein [Aurantiacibacter zhengii]|uniref:Thermonuclease family protein n=1 Tax=Aurantiacibacter zhengii TaxID=2307003 RepID=A0A418NP02_9SPHN|nr:thermonuclease family protein [Aurantiacibacter zhengii]RIV83381.1 thermonuclease family protein [Aurantiacibacter zhengii]